MATTGQIDTSVSATFSQSSRTTVSIPAHIARPVSSAATSISLPNGTVLTNTSTSLPSTSLPNFAAISNQGVIAASSSAASPRPPDAASASSSAVRPHPPSAADHDAIITVDSSSDESDQCVPSTTEEQIFYV